MGKIRVLSDQVANQIAAGEVVERPASVVKELLENSLDAGATRVRVEIEAGGRKLIRIVDNGHGMGRDDALLAFERHATSKLRTSDDLLSIATLGFRGEALPSIASVARVSLETRAAEDEVGTMMEIAGGNLLRVEDAGLPVGTTLAVRDLFFNTPARRKFLRAEQTELGHVAALVTHYALAHPEMHFELHSATQALLVAPAVANAGERLYQIFGREVFESLIPVAAEIDFSRAGLPEPPPWKRGEEYEAPEPGFVRLSGFVSKPELQKLNRNSIYVFVNGRLIRDKLILHAFNEAYRNIIPPTSFPVVLLFLEMPPQEVDVNVHPAKTEVRFRQGSFVHDFVRDSVRTALMNARPAASFFQALTGGARASESLMVDVSPLPGVDQAVYAPREGMVAESEGAIEPGDVAAFELREWMVAPSPGRLGFEGPGVAVGYGDASDPHLKSQMWGTQSGGSTDEVVDGRPEAGTLNALATLKPLGQLRDSFILAVNEEGLWIVDQHVAHERVLFEKILRERKVEAVQRQRLLMPVLIDLLPEQMVTFAAIAEELERNGFEAEPFGPKTLAVKATPVGLEGRELERVLEEVLGVTEKSAQVENEELRRTRIAASIACHAAIKVNMPLEASKMDWLLGELGKTEHPMSCPHGRPIALRYSLRDIQRAFQRI
ncbi:MAG: DNA mismatch repair endonuclease MutL [Acidobacteria bacterium]|nr:DNA mismatch repair endonuclease MutL [Acidobacteriota bacterium]